MPTCDGCGLHSGDAGAFRLYHGDMLEFVTLCPTCWAKRHAVGLRRSLVIRVMLLVGGAAILAKDPAALVGWLFIEAFAVQPLLTLAHELGHALTALALGMRVDRVHVGSGRPIWRTRLFGFPLVFHDLPIGGHTLATQKTDARFRLNRFLVTLAGPGANLGLAFAAVAGIGAGQVFARAGDAATAAVQAFAVLNAVILIYNLMPQTANVQRGVAASDGLALITVPFMPRETIDALIAYHVLLEGHGLIANRKTDEAVRVLDEGLTRFPRNPSLRLARAEAQAARRDYAGAREALQLIEKEGGLPPHLHVLLQNNLAWYDLMSDPEGLREEAAWYADRAWREAPWDPHVRGTRGGTLVERGEFDEAVVLLQGAMAEHESPADRGACAAYLALAEIRRGRAEEARRYAEEARRLDPHCPLLDRVGREMGTGGTPPAGEGSHPSP